MDVGGWCALLSENPRTDFFQTYTVVHGPRRGSPSSLQCVPVMVCSLGTIKPEGMHKEACCMSHMLIFVTYSVFSRLSEIAFSLKQYMGRGVVGPSAAGQPREGKQGYA